jgi:hypothetical protein
LSTPGFALDENSFLNTCSLRNCFRLNVIASHQIVIQITDRCLCLP